jgi:hypothetical protein
MSALPDVSLVAKAYRERGWSPLPLRGKVPVGDDWQNFVMDDATRFDGNIGNLLGKPSHGLVDTDLDCSQALTLATYLLPPTGAIFGRASKPRSHWLYNCDPPPETKQFQTKADGMLVELRSTGAQTMFPPSVHPSGEPVTWEGEDAPMRIDSGPLLRAVGDLAGMSLLARHWPAETGRYNAEGAFIGALLRAGRSQEQVVALLKALRATAGPAPRHPPEKIVERLAQKLATGQRVPGLVKLREHLGPDVVGKAAEWMGLNPRGAAYEERADGIYWLSADKKGQPIAVRLCNFTARITEVVNRDDGSGYAERRFVIGGNGGAAVQVPAKDFDAMHWVTREWGPWAATAPGRGMVERAAAAIKTLSEEAEERTVYTHIGWRKIENRWLYLHAGGAIGADGPVGSIEVDAPGELAHYALPPVRDISAAVRASLAMLEMGRIGTALAAATYRAPLAHFRPATCSVWLEGQTGVLKSAITFVAQTHWGAYWRDRAPANWSGTANSLERLASGAKDALLVIDDFAPVGTSYDIQTLHRTADRLMRAQGNQGGRSRMNPDATLKPTYVPGGQIVGSGEETPRGQSLRARTFQLHVGKDDVDPAKLTQLQDDAAAGLLSEAMAGYVQWLAAQGEELGKWFSAPRIAQPGAAHLRTSDNVASLAAGLNMFLQFAEEVGAIEAGQYKALYERAVALLEGHVAAQNEEQRSEDPTVLFLGAIGDALAAGRAHVATRAGGEPYYADACGWRRREKFSPAITTVGDDGETVVIKEATKEVVSNSCGDRIGWVDLGHDDLWLLPGPAMAAATRLLREGSGRELGLSTKTLGKRLASAGALVTTNPDQNIKQVRAEGGIKQAYHLRASCVLGLPSADDAPF